MEVLQTYWQNTCDSRADRCLLGPISVIYLIKRGLLRYTSVSQIALFVSFSVHNRNTRTLCIIH